MPKCAEICRNMPIYAEKADSKELGRFSPNFTEIYLNIPIYTDIFRQMLKDAGIYQNISKYRNIPKRLNKVDLFVNTKICRNLLKNTKIVLMKSIDLK